MLCEKIVVYIRLGLYLVAKKLKITEIMKLPVLVYVLQPGWIGGLVTRIS